MTNAKIVPSKVTHSEQFKSSCTSAALILTTFMLMVAAATSANAQVYTDIFNFDVTDGFSPIGVLTQGRDGNLYGTANGGTGTGEFGVVFKITPGGTETVLYNFDEGVGPGFPSGGLTLGADGNFYGTTTYGGGSSTCTPFGCGTIFKITQSGSLTTLYNFTGGTDGRYPYAPPIQSTDGNFYGVTFWYGTAYKLAPSGTLTQLGPLPGGTPAPLLQATDGDFYAPDWDCDCVFKMTPKGVVTILYRFDGTHGRQPGWGGLVQGSDGTFYGTTIEGGRNGDGVAYKLTPQGAITVLHNFADPNYANDGSAPEAGLVQATDGNFYGVTNAGGTTGNGVIFQITPAGVYSILYNFDGTHGATPWATPMQHTDGKIYGLTAYGGIDSQGVVYSLDMGLGPFVSLVSTSGKVGKTIEILGQGFTGTTAVSFNGTAATFSVISDTYLRATVPSGMTTGSITVTTPGGILTSSKSFQVRPVVLSFSPTSGPVGTPVTITGNSFIQTTRVAFGGVKATSFTVDSDTQVTATVPTGAKTGHIAITTAGGWTWSPGIFTVTQ